MPAFRRKSGVKPPTCRVEHSEFLHAVYRACLHREPDPGGLRRYLEQLESNTLDWEGVLRAVLGSEEFLSRQGARLLEESAMHGVHGARRILFRELLPKAEVVVDLGGASSCDPEGALFALGYPHAPRALTIVDLPPDKRLLQSGTATPQDLRAARGTRIQYLYGSMGDLRSIADSSVDLVVCGESIEHVSEEEADRVFREALRILRPQGHFCLDTPNARLTRIQSPGSLIHPEHQKEYRVSELADKLARHGFHIATVKGICPMPESLASGRFDLNELARNCRLSDDPEEGYLFFIDAVKAAAP
ncbi:MAG: methyltransferase domain-containing protein [Bryobacteraceae bacterium]